MINVKQIAKFVVALGENVSPMDIEEGMRVGVDRSGKYQVRTVVCVCVVLFVILGCLCSDPAATATQDRCCSFTDASRRKA